MLPCCTSCGFNMLSNLCFQNCGDRAVQNSRKFRCANQTVGFSFSITAFPLPCTTRAGAGKERQAKLYFLSRIGGQCLPCHVHKSCLEGNQTIGPLKSVPSALTGCSSPGSQKTEVLHGACQLGVFSWSGQTLNLEPSMCKACDLPLAYGLSCCPF